MKRPQHVRLRRSFRSRTIRLALALTVIGLIASGAILAAGQAIIGAYILGGTVAIVTLAGLVIQQRHFMGITDALQKRDEAFQKLERLISRAEWRSVKEVERVVSRAEWRNGESSRQLRTEIQELDASERLGRIEVSLSFLRENIPLPSSDSPVEHRNIVSEHDLELFLAHLLSDGHGKGN